MLIYKQYYTPEVIAIFLKIIKIKFPFYTTGILLSVVNQG